MKTLYLVRHAKSDWANAALADIDRPLNDRGYRDAHNMSLLLKNKQVLPDLIISSPAVRAISTALIFSRQFNYNPGKIVIKQDLYETSEKEYLKVISETDDSCNSVMLFAHNPTISSLADYITGNLPAEMPTCGIVGVQFNSSSWNTILKQKGNMNLFDYPKNNLF